MRALLVALLAAPLAFAQPRVLDADSLRADLDILRRTLVAYHPALDVYDQRAEVEARIDALDAMLTGRDAVPEGEAVVRIAHVVAAVRDGHTFLNPLNQTDRLRDRLWSGRTVLPFTFVVLGDRLVVTRDLTGGALPRGTEVLALDGVPIPAVLDTLRTLSPGDGRGTESLRRARLSVPESEITTRGWPLFDLYYPLVFPPTGDAVALRAVRLGASDPEDVSLLTRAERIERMDAAGALAREDEAAWHVRMLDDRTGYVRLGSFLSHRWSVPADTVLAQTVRQLHEGGADRVVLDVRGVVGGTLGYETVARYFLAEPAPCGVIDRVAIAAERADSTLFPYLESWDDGWKAPLPPKALAALPDGRFELRGAAACRPIEPAPGAFGGPLAVLSDAHNSSATFLLLTLLRQAGRAAVVGRPAGANRRGFSGGLMVMLRLPYSGVEVDVPLLHQRIDAAAPDAPLLPDVSVVRTAADVAAGRDPDLEAAVRWLDGR